MTGTFSYRHLVTFEDTHLMGSAYFANYLRWQGACREHFLAEHAPGMIARVRSGELVLVTLSCSCEYLAELHATDWVEVRMSLAGLHGNRIELRFDYLRTDGSPDGGDLVARGSHVTGCLRRTAGRLEPLAVPDELADAIRAVAGRGAA